jgi:uncharacterized protein YbcI
MTSDARQHSGGELLTQLSNEIVQAQKKYFGKGPNSAKSYILDDLLIVVMRGGLTTAEHTMVEFNQEDLVREFRQIFENEMTERLTGMVENLTGRKVLTYQSQIMFDPDVIVEMFVFDEAAPDGQREATGHGQIAGDDTGAADDGESLGEPASSGQ